MIFLNASIAVGLAVWLVLRTPAKTLSLLDRIAETLAPIAISVAVVCASFAALSIPFINVDLRHETIAELRALEQNIPTWAAQFSEMLPKWYINAALAVVALAIAIYKMKATPSQVAGLSRQQRVIARIRRVGSIATGAACGLTVASALTLFGDGVRDLLSDIQSEIHSAELRFEAGTDMLIRELAVEIVRTSFQELREAEFEDNVSWSTATDFLRKIRSGLVYQSIAVRDPSSGGGSPRVVLNALSEIVQLQGGNHSDKPNDLAKSFMSAVERGTAGEKAWSHTPIRETIKRNVIRELAESSRVNSDSRASERRELTKELLSYAADEIKEQARHDPLAVIFWDVASPVLTELIATFGSQSVLEPLMRRLWASEGMKEAKAILSSEVSARVKAATSPSRLNRLYLSDTADILKSLAKTGELLSAQPNIDAWYLTEEDMEQVVDYMLANNKMAEINILVEAIEIEDSELFFKTLGSVIGGAAEETASNGLLSHNVS